MKTKEARNASKEDREALNKKIAALTEEELAHVAGGEYSAFVDSDDYTEQETYEYAFRSTHPLHDADTHKDNMG